MILKWTLNITNVPFGTAFLMSNFFWHRNCASQPAASNPQRREARDPSERTHRSRGHHGPPRNFGKRGWDASRIKSSAPMGWVVYCAIGGLSPKLKGGRGVGGDHKPYKHETDVGSRQEFAFARKLDATWAGKNQIRYPNTLDSCTHHWSWPTCTVYVSDWWFQPIPKCLKSFGNIWDPPK